MKPTAAEAIVQLVRDVLGLPSAVAEAPRTDGTPPEPFEIPRTAASGVTSERPRVAAMIELNLRLAAEREPARLLDYFCASARKVIGAKYAVVGVLEPGQRQVRFACASGMSQELVHRLPRDAMPVMDDILCEQRPSRLRALPGSPETVGLPAAHPPVHSFLCAPIASPDRAYGWLCLADKVGVMDFSEEDEGVAQILAAQAGRIYENSALLAEVRQTVVRLEAEMAERRRVQEEFRRLNENLEQRIATRTAALKAVNQEFEAFGFAVSHDMRSPLTTIKGFADLLLNFHATRLDPTVRDGLENIREASSRMNALITDLLGLSRLAQHEVILAPVDLSALARSIIADLRRAEPERGVEATVATGLVAQGDVGLLRVVFENLLQNAWKFTRRCSQANVVVGSEDRRGRRVFYVRDNGVGFDPRHAGRLFGPFQRLHNQRDFPGAGMGLAVTRRIIHRHGGEIWAESAPGKGATFSFTLGAGSLEPAELPQS
jgi:signal transduction histidine kinase